MRNQRGWVARSTAIFAGLVAASCHEGRNGGGTITEAGDPVFDVPAGYVWCTGNIAAGAACGVTPTVSPQWVPDLHAGYTTVPDAGYKEFPYEGVIQDPFPPTGLFTVSFSSPVNGIDVSLVSYVPGTSIGAASSGILRVYSADGLIATVQALYDGSMNNAWWYDVTGGSNTIVRAEFLSADEHLAGTIYFHKTVRLPCPTSGDSVLDNEAVRQALIQGLAASGSDLPPGQRREHGGIIYRMPDGSYIVEDVPNALTGPRMTCAYLLGQPSPPPGGTPLARWHTHPHLPGDTAYNCSVNDVGTVAYVVDPRGNGGGSDPDWDATTPEYPTGYVINKLNEIVRLNYGVAKGAPRKANPNRWWIDRNDVRSCLTRRL